MADSDITRGYNPPANTRFCPEDVVTRDQMSAFLYRFANSVLTEGPQGPAGAPGADADWSAIVFESSKAGSGSSRPRRARATVLPSVEEPPAELSSLRLTDSGVRIRSGFEVRLHALPPGPPSGMATSPVTGST